MLPLSVSWVKISSSKNVVLVKEPFEIYVEYTLGAAPSLDDALNRDVSVTLNISYEGGPYYPAVSRIFDIQEAVRYYRQTIVLSLASPGRYSIYAEAVVV